MAKFSGAGAASGALSGASVGGMAGPIGAGVGALAGGALGAFGGGGSKPKLKKIPTLTEGQTSLLDMLLEQAQGMGGGLGKANQYYEGILDQSPEAFQKFSQPFMDQFNQQTIPGLAERFAGAGANGGALSSSGFGQSLSSAGGNLQNQLAQLKASLMHQASQGLYGQYNQMANQGLGTQAFGYQQQPGQTGGLQNFLSGYAGKMTPGDFSQVGGNLGQLYQDYMPVIGGV